MLESIIEKMQVHFEIRFNRYASHLPPCRDSHRLNTGLQEQTHLVASALSTLRTLENQRLASIFTPVATGQNRGMEASRAKLLPQPDDEWGLTSAAHRKVAHTDHGLPEFVAAQETALI